MPKSWSFRASIATFTGGILPGSGIRDPGSAIRLVPAGPVHAVLLADLAKRAGIDAFAPRGFAGLGHLVADLTRARLHVLEPAAAVVIVAEGHLDAVRHVEREPGMLDGSGRRARHAQFRVLLPVGVDLCAVARGPVHDLLVLLRPL